MTHDDGVYLDMSEDDYHADDALGSTDHKRLLGNPVQWQFARLSQLREELGLGDPAPKDAEATGKAFGSMIDTLILSGPAAFEAAYATPPEPGENYLVTRDQIRERLGMACTLPKSASLYDHQVLAKVHGLETMLDFARDKAVWMEGKTEVSRRWAAVASLIERMMEMPRATRGGRSMREVVLTGGKSQVSVFWTDETGLRLKARFDYLRIGTTIDLKTYAAREDEEPVNAFARAVGTYAYDVQAAHYHEARAQLLRLDRYGFTDDDHEWMDKVVSVKAPSWTWLTVQTIGMPEIDTLELPVNQLTFGRAQARVLEARHRYRTYAALYGDDQPWVADRPHIIMEDEVFNLNMGTRGEPKWRA